MARRDDTPESSREAPGSPDVRISFLGDPGWFSSEEVVRVAPLSIRLLQRAVQLDLGAQCDLRCAYCCAPEEGRPWVAPRAALRAEARAASRIGKTFPLLLGGEPLLHPDLAGVVSDLGALEQERNRESKRDPGTPVGDAPGPGAASPGAPDAPGAVLLGEPAAPGFGVFTNGNRLADPEFAAWFFHQPVRVVILSFDDFEDQRIVQLQRSRAHPARLHRAMDVCLGQLDRVELMLQVCVTSINFGHLEALVRHVAERVDRVAAPRERISVALNNMQVNGRGYDNAASLCADLERVVPEVDRAVAAGDELGIRVVICDFPPCVVPHLEARNTNLYLRDYFQEAGGPVQDWFSTLNQKLPGCARCRFEPFCSGIFPRYRELFPETRFEPIS